MNELRIVRMDSATSEHWAEAERVAVAVDAALPDRMLTFVRMLEGMDDGFGVDQLGHSLQTATRAERAGADPEVVLAALLHDVGKVFGDENHDVVSGEIVRPFVSDDVADMVRHHTDFTARYIAPIFGGDPKRREQWRDEPWFDLASRFCDEWDQASFEPEYPTEPLSHFEPLIRDLVRVDAP